MDNRQSTMSMLPVPSTDDGNGVMISSDKEWRDAARWIEGNGGYVHPGLYYDGASRQVYLGKPPAETTATTTTTTAETTLLKIPDSCLVTLHSVEADELFGKSLFGVVHSLSSNSSHSNDNGNDEGIGKHHKNKNDGSGKGEGLFHDAQDVILALYLAHLQHQLKDQEEQSSTNGNGNNNDTTDSSQAATDTTTTTAIHYQPYLATLPNSCHLPRQWSAETLERRLRGTSLYKTVLKEREGIRREYDLVKNAWFGGGDSTCNGNGTGTGTKESSNNSKSRSNDYDLFPPFEHYDNMMAVLTSRGFAGLGYDGVDALIPMFDLLNHVRGRGRVGPETTEEVKTRVVVSDNNDGGSAPDSNSKSNEAEKCGTNSNANSRNSIDEYGNADKCDDGGPDVRYERYDEKKKADGVDEDGSMPLSKRQRTMEDNDKNNDNKDTKEGKVKGGVRVSTAKPLHIGSVLHMTYGAKGNVALLGRYGFCIPNNVEPDGSCNDVLEIEIKPNAQPIKLQRGPKSYSYGPFVQALELCCHGMVANNRSDDDNASKNGNYGGCFDASNGDDRERKDTHNDDDGNDETVEGDDGGLEAFLDSCDNEMDNDEDSMASDDDDDDDEGCGGNDDFDDYMYSTSTGSNAAVQADTSRQTSITNDLRAIDVLKGILQAVKDGCVDNPLASLELNSINNNDDGVSDEDRYCAILIRSEIQTVEFYLAVADLLCRRLVEHPSDQLELASTQDQESSSKSTDLIIDKGAKDHQCHKKEGICDERVETLVTAFLSIRYPQMLR